MSAHSAAAHSASQARARQDEHTGHDKHAGQSVEMLRQKFLGTLLLSIPTLVWAPMTLIALAISVAFIFSLAVTFGFPGMDLWWELATLVTIMVLGHWIEMRSITQAQAALKELAKLLPDTAQRISGDRFEEVPVSSAARAHRLARADVVTGGRRRAAVVSSASADSARPSSRRAKRPLARSRTRSSHGPGSAGPFRARLAEGLPSRPRLPARSHCHRGMLNRSTLRQSEQRRGWPCRTRPGNERSGCSEAVPSHVR